VSDEAERAEGRVMSGEAWSDYCRMLEMAGHVILRDASPDDPLDRAEGYRYLSRLVRAGLEAFVEHADPRAPELRRMVHETVKMGSDNPDNLYFNAAISGAHRYRLRGQRGTVGYLAFGTQSGGLGEGLGLPPTGFVEAADLELDDDGGFEIIVSCERKGCNWLPMRPDSGMLIVRQTFGDRAVETPATLELERIDGPHQAAIWTPLALDEGLARAGRLVGGAAAMFANWAEGFAEHVNQLPRFDQELSNASGGDPQIAYYHSYWSLADDEALVIEATVPKCRHWNFQLNNHWMESLDYRYHPVTINSASARMEPDGRVLVVVAHRDPGLPNWISTAGHRRGTMCWRWIAADRHPEPTTRVVPVATLGKR
jgi:hypothetical protein